jgi:transcriptional regulator with XRE-family HTH domain
MAPSIGSVLRQAREVRELSAVDAARAAAISAAYLSKLENDAVKKPSPPVLLQLSEALGVPYADLMHLSGYHVPGESNASPVATVSAALFADLTDEEREELVDYLAWYRTRKRSGRGAYRGGRKQADVPAT